jgi:methanethiol S-methyltransferase
MSDRLDQTPFENAESPVDGGHISRLTVLIMGAMSPPPGRARILLALACGLACHILFALAAVAMTTFMYFGMSRSFGTIPQPWALLANGLLLVQFPLAHSLLLTGPGRRWLGNVPLGLHARALSTTTYATIASIQLLALFVLWSPSGIIWWQAEGTALGLITLCYVASWLLLMKASFDAGPEVQSGALGWLSVLQAKKPVYPDMPVTGLFRVIRHPIYFAFALTLWTVPVWTPDQLALATVFTAYCVLAPVLKERRFKGLYGSRFEAYRARVPYFLPRWPSR